MNSGLHHVSDRYFEEFCAKQKRLAKQIITRDETDDVQYVAGVDVSYSKNGELACAAIIVLNAQTCECVEQVYALGSPEVPYRPQFLASRELPLVREAWFKLTQKPDLYFYDGNGLLHQRKCGAASHFGVIFDVPVIGCAKNAAVPGERLKGERGDVAWIHHDSESDEVVGAQLITQNNVRPVYISVGHKVSLERAINDTLRFSKNYRLPEPIRAADHLSRSTLKAHVENIER